MHEGGSTAAAQVMAESPVKSVPEVKEAAIEAPVQSVAVQAPQPAVAQFVKADNEDAFKDAVENAQPTNTFVDPNPEKISASKKKRMKKKGAKAAKAGNEGAHEEEEEDVSDVSPLPATAATTKDFVEVISANQSYEAYYSADSESPADLIGGPKRR